MASPQIQVLIDRLAALPEEERKLRRECNSIVFPARDATGTVTLEITDEAKYAEINKGLAGISAERATIESKLGKLRALLGDNLYIGGTASDEGSLGRLRSDFAMRFYNKVLREHGMVRTPEEGIESEEYAALKAELQPQIEKTEARIKASEEKQAAAYSILMEQ